MDDARAGSFRLPSSQLFLDFCDMLVAKLPHDFKHGQAVSVSGKDGAYKVSLADGSAVAAGSVILALGFPGLPCRPAAFANMPVEVASHTEERTWPSKCQKGRRILVVGGGLTAVQAAQLAVKRGCKVSLCSRRPLTTRNFDIPVEWFDRRVQNRLRHEFWEQPSEVRLAQIKATRGGGSVPPDYMEQLKREDAAGKVEVVCGEVEVGAVDASGIHVTLAGQARRFDHVVLATGHRPDCMALPLLQSMQAQWPVEVIGGLPVLTHDLQWGDNEQLFLVGALAALQVGPDAANLMGCRRAANVVAQSLGLRLWFRTSVYVNRYAAFADSEDEDESDAESTDNEQDTGDASEKHPSLVDAHDVKKNTNTESDGTEYESGAPSSEDESASGESSDKCRAVPAN
eukprot:gnl/TRDRNA2_/TRDRNA2_155449_c1_seq1.p1 gnl/TRDRNA2_/TRDRNA2_155449_c1~~gnl/TRDRNA2_/TRDRNA2_155449_c1_seq1.p1  ORF type:complete len:447 (+),score=75.96 gnl/TRDRNA2_/TRDRNA2_155449_c1_seq1:143-1342(+)